MKQLKSIAITPDGIKTSLPQNIFCQVVFTDHLHSFIHMHEEMRSNIQCLAWDYNNDFSKSSSNNLLLFIDFEYLIVILQ